MGTRLLLVATWLMPVVIIVLGINTGATIWYYKEPQMGALVDPGTFYVAVISGFVVLALSVIVAVGISIHVATGTTAENSDH